MDRFSILFATQFVDLIRHINENWDVLVSCIRDGTLPDLKDIDHVREYLQVSQGSMNTGIVTQTPLRLSSIRIPGVQQNCLRLDLRSPLKDGSHAFGRT